MSGATFAIVARITSPRSRKPSSIVPVVATAASSSPAASFLSWMRRRPASRIAAAGPGVLRAISTAPVRSPLMAVSSTSRSTLDVPR